MYINVLELRRHLNYYLEQSSKEVVYITKYNMVIATLSNPKDKAYEEFFALEGIFKCKLDNNVDFDELIGEEILKRQGL